MSQRGFGRVVCSLVLGASGLGHGNSNPSKPFVTRNTIQKIHNVAFQPSTIINYELASFSRNCGRCDNVQYSAKRRRRGCLNLSPAFRGSQDAVSRNLVFTFLRNTVYCDRTFFSCKQKLVSNLTGQPVHVLAKRTRQRR